MQRSRPITLADVARAAGVSKATASKALNGDYPVAAATRGKVVATAERLGFEPSALATGLSTGRSRTVGLVVFNDSLERFVSEIALGVEEALRATDLTLILANMRGDQRRLDTMLSMLSARRADGLLVIGDNNRVWPSLTDRFAGPVVYAYGETDRAKDICHLPAEEAAVSDLVEQLLNTGRQRVAHVTGPRRSQAVRARVRGVRAALRRHRLPLTGVPLYGRWSQRWGTAAVEQLREADVAYDTLVCGSDQIAYGALTALALQGRRVPHDLAVTGYDNWRPFAEEATPTITTIDSNLESLGRAGAMDLSALIDGQSVEGGIHLHPCTIVVRESATEPDLLDSETEAY